MDVAGEQQNGIAHDMVKTRLSSSGEAVAPGVSTKSVALMGAEYCGSCYGAETEEVKVRAATAAVAGLSREATVGRAARFSSCDLGGGGGAPREVASPCALNGAPTPAPARHVPVFGHVSVSRCCSAATPVRC